MTPLAVIAAVMASTARDTPGLADDAALAVFLFWAVVALDPLDWLGRRLGLLPGRARQVLTVAVAAATIAAGAAFYSYAALHPGPGRTGSTPATAGPGRPRAIVVSSEAPDLLARVLRVNPDLSLVLEGAPDDQVETFSGRSVQTVRLAGVNAFESDAETVAGATRHITETVLGRVVVVTVAFGPNGGENVAGRGEPTAATGVFVFSGGAVCWTRGGPGAGGLGPWTPGEDLPEESLNRAVAALLLPVPVAGDIIPP